MLKEVVLKWPAKFFWLKTLDSVGRVRHPLQDSCFSQLHSWMGREWKRWVAEGLSEQRGFLLLKRNQKLPRLRKSLCAVADWKLLKVTWEASRQPPERGPQKSATSKQSHRLKTQNCTYNLACSGSRFFPQVFRGVISLLPCWFQCHDAQGTEHRHELSDLWLIRLWNYK